MLVFTPILDVSSVNNYKITLFAQLIAHQTSNSAHLPLLLEHEGIATSDTVWFLAIFFLHLELKIKQTALQGGKFQRAARRKKREFKKQ